MIVVCTNVAVPGKRTHSGVELDDHQIIIDTDRRFVHLYAINDVPLVTEPHAIFGEFMATARGLMDVNGLVNLRAQFPEAFELLTERLPVRPDQRHILEA